MSFKENIDNLYFHFFRNKKFKKEEGKVEGGGKGNLEI